MVIFNSKSFENGIKCWMLLISLFLKPKNNFENIVAYFVLEKFGLVLGHF